MPRHSPYALVRLNFLQISLSTNLFWFSHFFELLEFLKTGFFAAKRLFILLPFPPFGEIVFTLDWKDLFLVASISIDTI